MVFDGQFQNKIYIVCIFYLINKAFVLINL